MKYLVKPTIFALIIIVAVWLTAPSLTQATQGPAVPKKEQSAPLTLERCLTIALQNAKSLAAHRHELVALEEDQKATLWAPFSKFKIEGKFGFVPDKCAQLEDGLLIGCDGDRIGADEDVRGTYGPSFHIKFQGGIPIPTSKKMTHGKKALEERINATSAMGLSLENEIRYNVTRAFHAITGAREMRYTLSQGRKYLDKAQRKLEIDLENQEGTETQIDLVKLKMFSAQLDAAEQDAIKIERQGLAAMRFLLGRPAGVEVNIPDTPQELIDRPLPKLKSLVETAIAKRPELASLRHAVAAMEAQVALKRDNLAPTLSLGVWVSMGYTPGVQFKQRTTNGAGNVASSSESLPFVFQNSYNYGSPVPTVALIMKYPLNFGENIHRLRQAKAEMAAIVAKRREAVEGVIMEVETAYIDLVTQADAIRALERSRKLAKGWLTAASQNLATGLGPSKEVKDALKEYFTVMTQLHQKIAEYNIGLAKLDKATGIFKTSAKK